MMTRTEHMKQRRVQEKKLLKIALLALVLLIAATAASYYWFSHSSMPSPKRRAASQSVLPESGGKVNILVLGVDQRKDDIGRSDTLFLVTLDTKTKAASMLSIPRDTRVKIPGYGYDKINHAFSLGGHQLTQRAVEDLLGVPVDYYVKINFAGFSKIVDALGGVDIDVEKRMYYEDPYDDLVIDFKPGVQHMDGETAIKYVRYRDEEGDLGRITRQQNFIRAMMDEATSASILVRLPSIISEVSNTVETDLSVAEMLGMGKILNDARQQGLKSDVVPATPIDIGEISYLAPDVVALREHMARILDFKPDERYLAAAKRTAVEYQNSLPDETVLSPEKSATKPSTTVQPVKPLVPQKPSTAKPAKPVQPATLRANVVNASGNAEAGAKMAAIMRQQGFDVTGVSTSGTVNRNTIVIAHTSQNSVLSKVTGLPFNYALQVSPQAASSAQVTVVIGKDFAGR